MAAEPTPPQTEPAPLKAVVRRAMQAGWACVALSGVFLALGSTIETRGAGANILLWTSCLMAARLCGITSFAIGGIAIYNQRWTEGVALLVLSVGLPVVSFLVHGTI